MVANDIIAAIATAPGRGGIGVIRISGPQLQAFAAQLLGAAPPPRRATVTHFLDAHGAALDQGIALYFPAPHSYTAEDVLELQGHGGPIVLQLLLERCLQLGARIAQPGEFTQRAFLHGKLDLAQAEGVVDLINATTAQAARSALRSLQGEFSIKIQSLVSGLIELRALVEATLDFPEEEIDFLKRADASGRLWAIEQQLAAVLQSAQQGSLLREGARVVLVGQPNAGKSSLLNRLAGDDVAIVTEIPGTTRDAISQSLVLDGVPLQLTDTAGLRDSDDPIEALGVARTWTAIGKAEVVLLLIDATQGETPGDRAIRARFPSETSWVRVMNKIDLAAHAPMLEQEDGVTTVWVSAKNGDGIDLLQQAVLAAIGWRGTEDGVYLARARHLAALDSARDYLAQATQESALELLAEELRWAQKALSSITGEVTPDDLLGEIFSRFCVGK